MNRARLGVPGSPDAFKGRFPQVKKNPDGFFITIDHRTLTEVGKEGVIKDEAVALRLSALIELANAKHDVKVFRAFTLTGGQ